ncbi:Rid family hydrolase [Micromonospora ureilytica]|uniref:Rid family hydrolase n=1 Tax=Micromonospora ureilytica TaxID=709868 RepID=UPI002E121C89|nr:Rid family hydrolase [Micromonospora ureilytica]
MATISDTFNHGVPWEAAYGYSQALRVGDTVYVSGQLSHDDQGIVGENDIHKQCEVTFAHLDRVLEHFGATRRQVIRTTVILTNLRENFGSAAAAHSAYFGDHRPTSTTFGAVELALPGQVVEIGAVVLLNLPR